MLLDKKTEEDVYSALKNRVYEEYETAVQKEIFRLFSLEGQREVFEQGKYVPGLTALERLVMCEVVKKMSNPTTVIDKSFWKSLTNDLNAKAEITFDAVYWERVYTSALTTYYEEVLHKYVNREAFERFLDRCDKKIKDIERTKIKHLGEMTSSIENLKFYSYNDLVRLFGDSYAFKLKNSAHEKGVCLKGEIPEDLILLKEFVNNGLTTKTYNCFARNRMNSVGDIITFKDEAAAKKRFFELRGFGEFCWNNLLDFMDNYGYTFASREVKLEEHQKKLRSIK